ncbi:MAG: hypothetical protein CVT49_12005 [candidate division Zixibacteria bacterium HGW-Zixibacteria-1]|nr:MAG: hypothetical protein CVT49_12005 [candidate division Zixibacteria bacterium HGW-Zixibacteria-1]
MLWVLGFFATSTSYFGVANRLIPDKPDLWNFDIEGGFFQGVIDWFRFNPEISIALIIFIVAMVLLLLLIFFIFSLISIAGLIDGVYKIEKNESIKLSQLFKTGAAHFWRFLGLFLIAVVVGITFAVLIILPIVLAFIMTPVVGVLALLIGIPIGFGGIFFFGNIYSLAQREIVAFGSPVFQAIGEGYTLLIKHVGPNLVIFLIGFFLEIVLIIGATVIILLFAVPIVFMSTYSTWILVASIIIILPLFLMIAIVIEGLLGTFFSSLITLFYLELRKLSPKQVIPPASDPATAQS